ncbi:hypothetical protein GcM3_118021 [Golovinomyces cichoracearum]|uniref:Uncharacterized protein n=1 Tax=Golovinomyces cichoracearum TaxID=62708 RepID=A0A420I7L9_9PEZI|nr:hypothetical protein GcM3_118021 [Golovinomyces cichoracearum]
MESSLREFVIITITASYASIAGSTSLVPMNSDNSGEDKEVTDRREVYLSNIIEKSQLSENESSMVRNQQKAKNNNLLKNSTSLGCRALQCISGNDFLERGDFRAAHQARFPFLGKKKV